MKSRHTWNNIQANYWDKVSKEYSSLYNDGWSWLEYYGTLDLLRAIASSNSKCLRVLDLGSGLGLGYEYCSLTIECFEYVGVDLSPQMIGLARQRWPNGTFVQCDMLDIDELGDCSFDLVLSLFGSLSYCYSPESAIQKCYKLLSPSGRILISVFGRYALRRLVFGKIGKLEANKTRHSAISEYVFAHLFTVKDLIQISRNCGFVDEYVVGMSALGGLLENPTLWKIDQFFTSKIPNISHNLQLVATKPHTRIHQ